MLCKKRRKVNSNNNDLLSNENYKFVKTNICLNHKNCSGTTDEVNSFGYI